jgi:DNA-binding transcriptional ArsR family regulator
VPRGKPTGENVGIDILTISDLDTLKVVADPLRLEIFELLRVEPRTVKDVAAALDIPPTRLYYHFRTLEEHGLICVSGTRVVSGIIEKHYSAAAQRLSVDRSLLSAGDDAEDGLGVMLSVILDEARSEIRRSARAGLIDLAEESQGESNLILGRRWMRISPERAKEFFKRLMDLQQEYESAPEHDGAIGYEFLVGMYPTLRKASEVEIIAFEPTEQEGR